jgi:uncharacterized protein (DUF4213/DUF364 family)
MKILNDLLSSVKKDVPVKEVVIGLFQTAVLTEKCGLASTLFTNECCHGPMIPDAGSLHEKSAGEIAEWILTNSTLRAAVGMACLNSLLEIPISSCEELNAEKLLLEKAAGKKTAVVGHFPFIPRLKNAAGQLWVLEKRPHKDDLPAEKYTEIIPQTEVLAISATTLINHSFDEIMQLVPKDCFVIMLGGSTPLSPVLFDYRINVACGTIVQDHELLFKQIMQGASFRKLSGIQKLCLKAQKA